MQRPMPKSVSSLLWSKSYRWISIYFSKAFSFFLFFCIPFFLLAFNFHVNVFNDITNCQAGNMTMAVCKNWVKRLSDWWPYLHGLSHPLWQHHHSTAHVHSEHKTLYCMDCRICLSIRNEVQMDEFFICNKASINLSQTKHKLLHVWNISRFLCHNCVVLGSSYVLSYFSFWIFCVVKQLVFFSSYFVSSASSYQQIFKNW